jgi:hypothetical protein
VVAAWNELPPTGGSTECEALVEFAERLRWSAPELVVQYARRALTTDAGADGQVVVKAQAVLTAALHRLGRYADAVEPALVALRNADQSGVPDFASAVQLDLAGCARGLGEPLLGCAILRPVLDSTGVRPATRAGAIAHLVACAAHIGRRDDLEDALAEADRLYAADDGLDPDSRRLRRALLAVCTSAYHRRHGETEDAAQAAHDGLGLLARLRDPNLEGGQVRARLTVELVCSLLDEGGLTEADEVAAAVLAEPVRAAAAPAMGRLLLVMASRLRLPAGQVEQGRSLLDQAAWIGERHDLDWLVSDALSAIALLEEQSAKPVEALRALRTSHAAKDRHRRAVDSARRQLMIEFGMADLPIDAVNLLLRTALRPSSAVPVAPVATPAPAVAPVAAVPPRPSAPAATPPPAAPSAPLPAARTPTPARQPAPDRPAEASAPPAEPETDAATGLLTREGLSRRLQAVRTANRPVALTLVRLEPVEGEGAAAGSVAPTEGGLGDRPGAEPPAEPPPDALATLADRVRDMAPRDAELARSDGQELAVLLPHTTRDEAEEFAATIRESAIESDWLTEANGQEVSISTGVAESGAELTGEDADSLLTAARETLTPADRDRPAAAAPHAADQPVADLTEDSFLTTLAIPRSSGGRRRALDDEETPDTHLAPADPNGIDGPTEELEIRTLLAPLLGRSDREMRQTIPVLPEPDDVPDPPRKPDIIIPKEPDAVPPIPPEHTPAPEVPGPSRIGQDQPELPELPEEPRPTGVPVPGEPDEPHRPGVPNQPERPGWPSRPGVPVPGEPDKPGTPTRPEEPGWPSRPGVPIPGEPGKPHQPGTPTQPERPGRPGVPVPGEPDEPQQPGVPVQPDEPGGPSGPGEPGVPEPQPQPDPEPEAEQRRRGFGDESRLDAILGPVQGPEPRPPDLPPKDRRQSRRERSDTSIAELLAEALVAYQETAPEEPEPLLAEPVRHARELPEVPEVRENLPPAQRAEGSTGSAGRHRMPDWATSDRDGS